MTELPRGQVRTKRFPVVGERESVVPDLAEWRLVIEGLVDAPVELTHDELRALGSRDRRTDIHCVTGWSHLSTTWTGLPLADVLETVGVRPEARFVRFEAYSSRGHDTSLPLQLALDDSWLCHSRNLEPLEPAHGAPLRVVTPSRYFYKSLKWVHRIELLAEDRLGYWERESSYHNNGDPWAGTERFTTGSLRPDQLERFLLATDYRKYRRKVLLGLDLRSWTPGTADLRELELKNCDLRSVDLSGVDLRYANLSLSDLRGASLRGARLRSADLEGADLRGANLAGADLRDTALSATRFEGAQVQGLKLDGAFGLLESEEPHVS